MPLLIWLMVASPLSYVRQARYGNGYCGESMIRPADDVIPGREMNTIQATEDGWMDGWVDGWMDG